MNGRIVRLTLNRPERRNALSGEVLAEIWTGLTEVAAGSATGLVLAANGPVFSAGHDFADVAGRDVDGVRELLTSCTAVMALMQSIPQVVIARVHGLATAAGCQLVASADLAVAARSAGFALPGGKGGWFCHTPAVPVARAIGRKRLMEMALTGDVIDAAAALDWGLVTASSTTTTWMRRSRTCWPAPPAGVHRRRGGASGCSMRSSTGRRPMPTPSRCRRWQPRRRVRPHARGCRPSWRSGRPSSADDPTPACRRRRTRAGSAGAVQRMPAGADAAVRVSECVSWWPVAQSTMWGV